MTTDSTPPAPTRDTHAQVLFEIRYHEQAEWETEVAHWQGQQAAYTDIAAGHAELAATWRATGRATYEQRVAERIAEMEACAAAGHAQHGTKPWAGLDNGAVLPTADWHTTTVTTIHHGRAA